MEHPLNAALDPARIGGRRARGRSAGFAAVFLLVASATIPGWSDDRSAPSRDAWFPVESPSALERLAAPGRAFVVDGLRSVVLDTAWVSSFDEASDLPWAQRGFERLAGAVWRIDAGSASVGGLFGNEIGDAHLQELGMEGMPPNRTPVLGGEAIARSAWGTGEAQTRVAFDQNDEFSARTLGARAGRIGAAHPGEMAWFGENLPFRSALGGGVLLARGDGFLQADGRSGWWWTSSPASGDLVPWRGAEGSACLGSGFGRIRGAWMDWRSDGADRRGRWTVGEGGLEAWGRGGGLEWSASLAARSRELSWPGRFQGGRAITFPAALALATRLGDRPSRHRADGDAARPAALPLSGRDRGGFAPLDAAVSGGAIPSRAVQERCAADCFDAGVQTKAEGEFLELRPRLAGENALAEGRLLWSAAAFLRRGRRVPEVWELLETGDERAVLRAETAPAERRLGGDLAVGYRLEAGVFELDLGSGLAWEDGATYFAPDSFFADGQGLPLRSGRWARARAYAAPRARIEAHAVPFPAFPAAGVFAAATMRDAWGSGAGQLDHRPARTVATLGLRGRFPSDLAYEAAISHVGDKRVRGWRPDGSDFRVPAHWEGWFGLTQSAFDGRLHLSLSGLNAFGRELLEYPGGNEARFRILIAARYAI